MTAVDRIALSPPIRVATKTDIPGVVSLYKSFMQEITDANSQHDFSSYRENAINNELLKLEDYYLKPSKNTFFVVEIKNRICASIGIERVSSVTAEIRRLLVLAEHRRQGMAIQLMNRVEAECLSLGYQEIILETSELQQASVSLYKKLDYIRDDESVTDTAPHKGVKSLRRYRFRKKLVKVLPSETSGI